MYNASDIFLKLVKYNTASDDESNTIPTTASQVEFAGVLKNICKDIGLSDVSVSEFGYVYATLPSNCEYAVPAVGFVAHMDTSPEFSGENVNPLVINNYDCTPIILNKNNNIILSPKEFPSLNNYSGHDLIVTDGTTLLGADDKAGIAEIIAAAKYLIANPEIKHGDIKICFTPDEEVGKGADKFDIKYFGADFAYTLDGSVEGELEYENFNAARAKIKIKGKSVHPGYAKDIMVNAGLIAVELMSMLPNNETPATTSGYEGYYHIGKFNGNVEEANINIAVRDFDKDSFEKRKEYIKDCAAKLSKKYGEDRISLNLYDEYYNMFEIVNKQLFVIDYAKEAMEKAGVKPLVRAIRGGTDGCRLSYMGLVCPNIFTGGENYHGPYEFISIQAMEKAVETILNIVSIVCTK